MAGGPDERQPLLEADGDGGKASSSVWATELRELLHLAAPACLQLCSQQGLVVRPLGLEQP